MNFEEIGDFGERGNWGEFSVVRKFECGGNLVERVLETLRCCCHLHRMRNEGRQ